MRRSMEPIRPGWPALMPAELAAGYLSPDMTSFRKLATAAGLVSADLEIQLERWRWTDLDSFVAQLALRRQRLGSSVGRGHPLSPSSKPWTSPRSRLSLHPPGRR